jgi:hypothetical protein
MNFNYNLYLDDIRFPLTSWNEYHNPLYKNNEWIIARSYDEFIELIVYKLTIEKSFPSLISFDHDLGDTINIPEKSGMMAAKWLVDFCMDNNLNLNLTKILVHSSNPAGKQNIMSLLNNFKLFTLNDYGI